MTDDELGHLALCAWNNWAPSDATKAIWDEWAEKAPKSREGWLRVVRAIRGKDEQGTEDKI